MHKIELPTVKLCEALSSVVPAASTSEKDPPYNGVSIVATPEELVLQATNGHWLARYTIDVDEPIPDLTLGPFEAFVPLTIVKKWLALIEDATDGTSTIVRSEKLVRASFTGVGMVEWTVGAVEVIFPVTPGIWPTDPPHAVESTKIDFRRMAPVARAFEAAGSDGSDMRSEFRGPMRPIVVTSESAPALVALVMPCATKEEKAAEDERQLEMFGAKTAVKKIDGGNVVDEIKPAIDRFFGVLGEGTSVTISVPGSDRKPVTLRGKPKQQAKKPTATPKRSHHKKK